MSDQAMTREDKLRFERAPCYLCGYNSHDYYQPNVHPCAKLYHMPEDTVESLREELAQMKQERDGWHRDATSHLMALCEKQAEVNALEAKISELGGQP